MAVHAPMRRHDFAWLDADVASWLGAAQVDADGEDAVDFVDWWVRRGYPLVVARQHAVPIDHVRLGTTRPAPQRHARVALVVPRRVVGRVEPPPPIDAVIDAAPPGWRATMRSLASLCAATAVAARVYGSLALQRASGAAYLADDSDLDVQFDLGAASDLAALLEGLRATDGATPRIDGEIRHGAWAVAWREVLGARQRGAATPVLAKGDACARLLRLEEFLAGFAAVEGAASSTGG